MNTFKFEIRPMDSKDGRRVLEIFQQGIDAGNATYDQQVPPWESWDTEFFKFSRFVIETEDDEVIGWAAIKPTSKRECFNGVAEVSVYVDQEYLKMGLGRMLLKKLILDSEAHGIWTLQSGIFPSNKGSIALHQKEGFRTVGIREKIGKLNGVWEDIVLLERRSRVVGID